MHDLNEGILEAINKYGLIDGYRKTYSPVKKYLEGIK